MSTLLSRVRFRPTGIERVELETALALAELLPDVAFCKFDRLAGVYGPIGLESVRGLAETMRGQPPEVGGQGSKGTDNSRGRGLRTHAERAIDGRLARFPRARPHIRRALSHSRRALTESWAAGHALWQDIEGRRETRDRACLSDSWGSTTTYCSFGMGFAHNDLSYLRQRRDQKGFRVAMMVYDLIPVMAPQFSLMDLTPYFEDLISVCDLALTISEATQQDITTFARDRHLREPSVRRVPLGSALKDVAPSRPPALPERFTAGAFALTVGNVTLRKNHHLLLDVWEMLSRGAPPADIPLLVIAGSPGILSDGTLSRLGRDPALRSVAVHLDNASDAEIAWLYGNCAMTLYPSLYEGWGLPIGESHDFGRICIASDRTSVLEAGEGLAVHLDPLDRGAWRDKILYYWNDAAARRDLEERIRSEHHRVTAADTARAVAELLGVGGRAGVR